MKRTFNLRLFSASVTLVLAAGCGQVNDNCNDGMPPAATTKVEVQKESEALPVSTDESEGSMLNVEDLNEPEGVVNAFLRNFFSGNTDGARRLLTLKAQKMRKDSFVAQESDCCSWTVIDKTKVSEGEVSVLVLIEDYDDVGEFQTDRVTFFLKQDNSKWRIAAFEIGELKADFEQEI